MRRWAGGVRNKGEGAATVIDDTKTGKPRGWIWRRPPWPCCGRTSRSARVADVPVHVVSRRLGHASPVVTMTVIAHVLPGSQREAADLFARLIGAA